MKSTALKTLAQPWFTNEIAELGSKDPAMQTRGVWVIEIAELDSLSRTDVSKLNGFISGCRRCVRRGNSSHPGESSFVDLVPEVSDGVGDA